MEINDDNATERYRQIAQEAHEDAMMYRDKLEAAELRIAELEQSLERQAKAAISGMDAAKAVASSNLEQATRLRAECSPEALESERAANALLTERIAELEEREQALAAHVERMQEVFSEGFESLEDRDYDAWEKEAKSMLASTPATSLARRDALNQAEALENLAQETVTSWQGESVRARARNIAKKLRRQAEAQQ